MIRKRKKVTLKVRLGYEFESCMEEMCKLERRTSVYRKIGGIAIRTDRDSSHESISYETNI